MPLLIKRYPNRKLYNTQSRRYLSLKELAGFVRDGQEIQVLDHSGGQDITTVILVQIIQEQEKSRAGIFPSSFLASLVRSQGDMVHVWRHLFGSSDGLERYISDEIERRINLLVEEQALNSQEGHHLAHKMIALGHTDRQPVQWFDRWINQYLDRHGFASRWDYEQLSDKLDELQRQLEELGGGRPGVKEDQD